MDAMVTCFSPMLKLSASASPYRLTNRSKQGSQEAFFLGPFDESFRKP